MPVKTRSGHYLSDYGWFSDLVHYQGIQKKSWVAQFKEFRAYGECVLDYLRSQVGYYRLSQTLINLEGR